MKTIFKLFGLTLLSSMLIFTSCKDDKDDDKVNAPTGLNREIINESDVKLTWSGDADSYELSVGGKTYTTTQKTYTVTDLAEGTYEWQVRAKKGDKFSEWAKGASFTIEKGSNPPTLSKPEGLAASNISAFSVIVKFKKTNDAEKYEVYIGETLTEILKDSTSSDQYEYCYSPVELTPSTSYTWRVRAIKGEERSEWVEGSTFTTLANPGTYWTKVSFQKGNYKEFWAVHRVNGSQDGVGGVESTSYFNEEDMTAILNVISLSKEPTNANDIRPHHGAFLTFPGVIGTYPLTETAKSLFVDYSDRSFISHGGRRGDWVSTQGDGAIGNIKVTKVQKDEQNKVYWVSGTFEATVYDSRKLNENPPVAEMATVKVEVNSMALSLSTDK